MNWQDRRGGCDGAVAEALPKEWRHGVGVDGAERMDGEGQWTVLGRGGLDERKDSDALQATEEGQGVDLNGRLWRMWFGERQSSEGTW